MSGAPLVAPDIGRAATLPSWFYHHPEAHSRVVEEVFARGWQFAGEADAVKAPGHVRPFTLLEGCLDEPLLLARGEDGELRCLSNVCTHRGALVVEGEGHVRGLRCRYHGRRFGLDGCLVSMPEFDGVEGFPSSADHLPRLPLERFGPLLFTALREGGPSFQDWMGPVLERVGWLPLERMAFDPSTSRDYLLDASWIAYCDNYLEEFHIPYVHGASLAALDYAAYRTERFAWGNLQFGFARTGEGGFELPPGHPDEGQAVAAWYFWLFPNLMLNFYPWGLSVNVVVPLGPGRTRVAFRSYVLDPARRGEGLGADLHRVEMEDEAVVESVQRGVRSRLYQRGRFSPRREVGTHHFHELLSARAGIQGHPDGGMGTSPTDRAPAAG